MTRRYRWLGWRWFPYRKPGWLIRRNVYRPGGTCWDVWLGLYGIRLFTGDGGYG